MIQLSVLAHDFDPTNDARNPILTVVGMRSVPCTYSSPSRVKGVGGGKQLAPARREGNEVVSVSAHSEPSRLAKPVISGEHAVRRAVCPFLILSRKSEAHRMRAVGGEPSATRKSSVMTDFYGSAGGHHLASGEYLPSVTVTTTHVFL